MRTLSGTSYFFLFNSGSTFDNNHSGSLIKKMHIAHVKQRADGEYSVHSLQEHLLKVGILAGRNASFFGGEEWAQCAGIWHDLGKYSIEFQNYIKTASGYNAEGFCQISAGSRTINA